MQSRHYSTMHGIRRWGGGGEINVSKSGIMYIIAKSERRSEIWPHCGWLRDSDGGLLQQPGLCVDEHL